FNVADRDNNFFAWENIGHRLSEDVRPLLIQKTCDVPRFARGFINRASFFATLDQPSYRAIANNQRQVVNHGVLWQRKSVNGFDLFLERIREFMGNDRARNETTHLNL